MKNKQFFSIIIPTLNEVDYLPQLLQDLTKQTNNDFEVIVVDGQSTDKTAQLAKSFERKLRLNIINAKKRNVSYQRNLGIDYVTGTWIIFMDADNRLPIYFLDGLKYQLAKYPKTDLFTTWITLSGDKKLNQPLEKSINFALEFYKMIDKESAFGSMIGVKNKIAHKYKFDEKQLVMEDSIFVKNIVKHGFNFMIFKEPTYTYSLRRIEKSSLLKNIRTSANIILNYYIKENDFTQKDFGYSMKGGEAYKTRDFTIFKMFLDIEKFIHTQPESSLKKAKNLFQSVKNSF
jgi:glycosyltransferase involved in cell wall biosynthesis